LVEFFEDCPDIGRNLSSLSIRKTVSGTRDTTGMDKLPHFLSLMPNLQQFKSVLGSYYSPVYENGPHYLTLLPASTITHLSEEIGRAADLDRIRSIQWSNLQHLSLHQAFIHDNCLFELLTSEPFCGLATVDIVKFDEFNEVDLITNDMRQWHEFPPLNNLRSLNLNHWNQQAHSNNLSHRVLGNFLIHRSSQLHHVTLEGRYITDTALQLLLFTDRATVLQSLTLRNSCETLDPTCAILSSIDERSTITPQLHSLILEQVPLTLIQSMLSLSGTVKRLRLNARDSPKSLSIQNHHEFQGSFGFRDSFLDLSCYVAENSTVPRWEEVSLENISLSASDAKWLLNMPVSSYLRKLTWKNFSGLDEDDVISIFSSYSPQENTSNGLEMLSLHPSTQMSSVISSSTYIAEAFMHWLRVSNTMSMLRSCSISYIAMNDMFLKSLLMKCPRLAFLSATHIYSLDVSFQQICSQLKCSDYSLPDKVAPLRYLHVSHLPNCHWPSLVMLVRDFLPTLLQLQVEHCGQTQLLSSAEEASREEGNESPSVPHTQSRLAMLWELVESVRSRPCKVLVDGQRILPVKA
jgi:hypothetical protein